MRTEKILYLLGEGEYQQADEYFNAFTILIK